MYSEEYSPKTLPSSSAVGQKSYAEAPPNSPATPRLLRHGEYYHVQWDGQTDRVQWDGQTREQLDVDLGTLPSQEGFHGRPAPDLNKPLPPVPAFAREEPRSSNSVTSSPSSVLGSTTSSSTISSVARKLHRVPTVWRLNALDSARSFQRDNGGKLKTQDNSEAVTESKIPDRRVLDTARPSSLRAFSDTISTLRLASTRKTRMGMSSSDESEPSSSIGTAIQHYSSDETPQRKPRSMKSRPSLIRFLSDSKSSLRRLRSISEDEPRLINSISQDFEPGRREMTDRNVRPVYSRLRTSSSNSGNRGRPVEKETMLPPSPGMLDSTSTVSTPREEKGRLPTGRFFRSPFRRKRSSAEESDQKRPKQQTQTSPTQGVLESVTMVLESSESSKRAENKVSPESDTSQLSKSSSFKRMLTLGRKGSKESRRSPVLSITSSLRKLMRGKSPLNTPVSPETYKGSDSKDYFKVELTHPNGPSFLPSEATRVSTPRMPGERPNRNDRRGFFFDYIPPDEAYSPPKDKVARSSTLRPGISAPSEEKDWFRLRMEMIINEPEPEQFDLNVPEHFAGSPLCPLSPKHRSGGKGICVYHGRGTEARDREDVWR